jgi:hypothetical protein
VVLAAGRVLGFCGCSKRRLLSRKLWPLREDADSLHVTGDVWSGLQNLLCIKRDV